KWKPSRLHQLLHLRFTICVKLQEKKWSLDQRCCSGKPEGRMAILSGLRWNENSSAIKENSFAVKENSPAINENSFAVKENSPAIKENSFAVKENSPAINENFSALL